MKTSISYWEAPIIFNKLNIETRIMDAVSQTYNILKSDLIGKSQKRIYVIPRHTAMWLLEQKKAYSLEKIASLFNRDHSTVIHARRKINDEIDCQTEYGKTAQKLLSYEI